MGRCLVANLYVAISQAGVIQWAIAPAGAALTPPPTGAAYPTLTLPAGPQGAPGVAGPTGPPGPPGPATGLQTQTGTPITSLLPGMGMELVTVEGVCTINLVVPS